LKGEGGERGGDKETRRQGEGERGRLDLRFLKVPSGWFAVRLGTRISLMLLALDWSAPTKR